MWGIRVSSVTIVDPVIWTMVAEVGIIHDRADVISYPCKCELRFSWWWIQNYVALCGLVDRCQQYRGTCCLHLQCRSWRGCGGSSDVLGPVQQSMLHYTAAVTYCTLSNRVRYITLQQWHTAPCSTEYATLHSDHDVLGLGQQSKLHHSVEVTYWALSDRLCYITLQHWCTGVCPVQYTTLHLWMWHTVSSWTKYATSHCNGDILGLV